MAKLNSLVSPPPFAAPLLSAVPPALTLPRPVRLPELDDFNLLVVLVGLRGLR